MTQSGKGHQLRVLDAAGQQPGVARVDDPVGRAVQDQRAGTDLPLPETADVSSPGGGLGLPRIRVAGRERWLAVDDLLDEFRAIRDGRRGQGVCYVAAQCLVGREAPAGGDQPDGLQRHRVGEQPSRRGAREDEPADPVGVPHGEFLGDHASETRAEHVRSADPGIVEHG